MNFPKLRFKDDDGREFSEWSEKPLQEVCKINQGLQIPISERFTDKGDGRHFYITNEFLKKDSTTQYFIENPPSSVLCTESDVLMTRTGNTGKVVTGVNGAFHNNFFKINFDKAVLNKIFLCEFLSREKTQFLILKLAGTSTIPDLNHSDFYKITMQFPSLPEQTKIANFLTAIDEKITQLTQKYDLLKQYKKGVMQQIFSQKLRFKDDDGREFPEWEELAISEIFQRSTHSSKAEYIVNDGMYIVVDMGSISRDAKLLVTKKTNFSNDFLTTSDLVMAKDDIGGGNIIGRVVQIPENRKYVCSDHVYKLTIRNGYVGYFHYAINSSKVNKSFRQKANGTAQIGISNKTVDDQLLPVPTLLEQIKIANFLTAIDDKITHTRTQLDAVKLYKKGLLQQLFV